MIKLLMGAERGKVKTSTIFYFQYNKKF
jgi:hypothetical protein